ncbi:hypothetical protein LOTGIDRAFT_112062, partial [Lottia gigantea]
GYFWQVTDFHYDSRYSVNGVPSQMCHQGQVDKGADKLGQFGNYLCDAPWKLITSAIEGMKSIHDSPDFILWTGDSIPHVNNSDLNLPEVYTIIGNVTDKLIEVFPNTTIFPVLGNHDAYPSNQMVPGATTGYYTGILQNSRWTKLLGSNQQTQFENGGYYSVLIQSGLKLLGLNTNLYYDQNKLVADIQDPAGQLEWMEQQLEDSRTNKQKVVYIISHVPPGAFERVKNIAWFYPQFNQQYIKLLLKYTDLIVGQFYGHEHTDSFRILLNEKNQAVSSLFLAPAVTPWKSTLPGVGANNPGIRLYMYRKDTGAVLDFQQYFLNLTKANSENQGNWELEYQATSEFTLSDTSVSELDRLVQSFHNDEFLFNKYLLINSVSQDTNPNCTGDCKHQQICAIRYIDFDMFSQCITGNRITTQQPYHTTRKHHHRKEVPEYMLYVIGTMGGVILIMTIVFACFCVSNRKKRIPYKYAPINPRIN